MPYRGDLLDPCELCYVMALIMDCPFISITLIKAKLSSFVQSFNKYLLWANHRVMLKIWWWAEEDLVPATWGGQYLFNNHPINTKLKLRKEWPLRGTWCHKSTSWQFEQVSEWQWLTRWTGGTEGGSRKAFQQRERHVKSTSGRKEHVSFDFCFFQPIFITCLEIMIRKCQKEKSSTGIKSLPD